MIMLLENMLLSEQIDWLSKASNDDLDKLVNARLQKMTAKQPMLVSTFLTIGAYDRFQVKNVILTKIIDDQPIVVPSEMITKYATMTSNALKLLGPFSFKDILVSYTVSKTAGDEEYSYKLRLPSRISETRIWEGPAARCICQAWLEKIILEEGRL